MKFDVCIGNPPYNSDSENGLRSAKAIYPYFIIGLNKVADKLCMITPSRWFNGNAKDSAYDDFREFFKNNNHMKSIINYTDSTKVFPNNAISGSVSYFYFDSDYTGDVKFRNITPIETTEDIRPLFSDGVDIIFPRIEMSTILQKVLNDSFKSINEIIKLDVPTLTDVKKSGTANDIICHLVNYKTGYIERESISSKYIDNYYVFTANANGSAGILLDGCVNILGKIRICKPNEITDGGFTVFGLYDNEQDAMAVKKYLDTKFARLLVGLVKASHRLNTNVFRLVPLQDFTKNSDIDWDKDVKDVDQQLYTKYELTKREIDFIDKYINYIEY